MTAKEYRNERGDQLWQPMTEDGARLWLISSYSSYPAWESGWRYSDPGYEHRRPCLYKSKARAERIARRRQRRRDRAALGTFREVES